MSELEIIAATLGLANIVLIIRRSIWNYPFGIAMVCLYGWIFYDARLYSDALLQVFFVALNVYGWVNWTQARQGGEVPVRWMTPRSNVLYLLGTALVWLIWSTAMARLTNAAAPYWDGAVACMSVTGQILLARRHVENWVYWIIVDVFAIGLFWSRGLQPTAGLYAVFLVMAAVGLARWARAARRSAGMTPHSAVLNIVLHGPESTGKSTLAAALAAHYGTVVVPEYGRDYCEEHGTDIGPEALVYIMRGHIVLTEQARAEAARRGRALVISDTDPLMTAAWAMMTFGRRLPELDAFEDVGDLYLLMLDDIPWTDDGLRLHRTAEERARFMQLSRSELDRRGVRYVAIGGSADERFARALAAIDELVAA